MDANEIKQAVVKAAATAKLASRKLVNLTGEQKNKILIAMAEAVAKEKDAILFRNEIDVEAAKESGLSDALIDRLVLNEARILDMSRGLREVAVLADPVGELIADWTAPVGIQIQKIRVPLGVIGIIYESRPNVTVDATGLCIKAGNAVILRGGSEAINSNHTLVKIISKAAYENGLAEGAIQFVETTDRQAITEMVKLDSLIDLIIPRGGEEMIRSIKEQATVPILSHGKGLCHTYIHKKADIEMAKKIAFNAKCQRPGVCNATETLLVDKEIASKLLPSLYKMYADAGVEVRGSELARQIVPEMKAAQESDWAQEYLDMIISIKVVESIDEAINHINKYGSGHTDAIITQDNEAAQRFFKEVDSAAVMQNASTRLHDGGVFGLGSEIGISTQKLHARGTMGVKELTTTKYIVYGHGETRQ
jgi:glutamate-5-semialdehyde dehydrogenase